MENLESMKCINVTHRIGKEEYKEVLTYYQFWKSFVIERWSGERRTNKKATMFGYHHTKTSVTSPFDKNHKSVRIFDFPSSREEAEKRHDEYLKNEGV